MSTTCYLLEPRAPLVLRTGRPFDQAGDPVSLAFPLPSTMAGACRTAYGDGKRLDFTDPAAISRLRSIAIQGPLAAVLVGKTVQPLLPRPMDCFYCRKPGQKAEIQPLCPQSMNEGEFANLPHPDLLPVFLQTTDKVKPAEGDGWWTWDNIQAWLGRGNLSGDDPAKLGWSGPERDLRTHAALEPETLAARTGMLFQTEGLSFASCRRRGIFSGWQNSRHGILVRLPTDQLEASFCRLGGEGRICSIHSLEDVWPRIPDRVERLVNKTTGIRIVLATPAIFAAGWYPGWLDEKTLEGTPPGCNSLRLRLRAFAASRWQPVSGWDLEKRQPRAVRRMVPAGSVYWFDVLAGHEEIRSLWLHPVSDDTQDRLDGFGLALIGTWEKKI